MDAEPALVSFAREAMDRELSGKLESEGLIDSRSGARLELCLEKIHLRSTLMTFLFYPVVHPDQLKVKVTLLNGDKPLNTWHLNAENDAGGYMAAPGRERRFLMLVSLISRKVVHLLKKPLRKPA